MVFVVAFLFLGKLNGRSPSLRDSSKVGYCVMTSPLTIGSVLYK